jgi:regulator of protease activity HflC (stomatin/prohibitin superfamily)
MGNILATLKEWLEFVWPFVKVGAWEKAMRGTHLPAYPVFFKDGKFCQIAPASVIQVELGPGMHRRIPWIEEVYNHSVVEDTITLELQNITSKDGEPLTVKVVIVFEIFNVKNATTEVHDYENSLRGISEIHTSRQIRTRTWDELRENQEVVEAALKEALHERSKKWGTRVKEVGFSTLVVTEQINRFNVNQ